MVWSSPGSSVHGIPQARILEWVAIPFPRGPSPPRMEPRSAAWQKASLPLSHPEGPTHLWSGWGKKREYRLLVSEMTEGTAPRIPWTLHKITKEDYAHEVDNLDETDQIPERHSLPKPFQEEIDNLNRKWKWKSLSHVRLFATPWTVWNSPGQNTWAGGHSLLQGSFQPRDWTQGSHTAGRFFTSWVIRETQEYWSG